MTTAAKPKAKPAKGKAAKIKPAEPKVGPVRLANLTIDYTIQPRESKLNEEHVCDLLDALKRGAKLPPVVVYKTAAGEMILSKGFHRAEAYRRNGSGFVPAEIRDGERIDAAIYAMSEEPSALKRTAADKRRAIRETLRLAPKWTDRRIADHVGVDSKTVADVRAELEAGADIPKTEEREAKDGRTVKPKEPKPAKPKAEKPAADAPPSAEIPHKDAAPPVTASAPLEATSAPQPDPDAPPAVALDAMRLPIPAELVPAFECREKFERLTDLLKECRTLVTEIGEHAGGALLQKRLQWQRGDNRLGGRWALADLDNALATVQDSAPAVADCPFKYAEAEHTADCPLCRGAGFSPDLKYRQVPAELMQAMTEARTATDTDATDGEG